MGKIALIAGTRPEIIKLAPLYLELSDRSSIEPELISSGQQAQLLSQAMEIFSIRPGVDLALMEKDQSPEAFLGKAVPVLSETLSAGDYQAAIVQGDTTTALAGALAAFHLKIPVFHIEAGLRTGDMNNPFPEEMNRCLIGKLAKLHFCPTKRAADNLKKEGISEGVYITGNTVVDSALWCREQISAGNLTVSKDLVPEKPFILVTCHRRENFDAPLKHLCQTLAEVGESLEDTEIIFPVHLNPNVEKPIKDSLGKSKKVRLLPPLSYPEMIHLIEKASLIVTDSGGIQEEAPSFGTPVIVTRISTERPEAIEAGAARLVALNSDSTLKDEILGGVNQGQIKVANPFGDGKASEKIKDILLKELAGVS